MSPENKKRTTDDVIRSAALCPDCGIELEFITDKKKKDCPSCHKECKSD